MPATAAGGGSDSMENETTRRSPELRTSMTAALIEEVPASSESKYSSCGAGGAPSSS